MPAIIELAATHGRRMIEDSAETLGAHYPVGKLPGHHDVGCVSLFPAKNITTGEGGMLTTSDDELAARVRAFIAHGIDSTTYAREKVDKPWLRIAQSPGFNFRLSNVLAAIGVEQMKRLDETVAARRQLAARYIERLSALPWVEVPTVPHGFSHSWQMFTILVPPEQRDAVLAHLRAKEVGASVHFDPPVHRMPAYASIRRTDLLQNTEELVERIITLPMYPSMTTAHIHQVCDALAGFALP
jgi:perosamine synthetase